MRVMVVFGTRPEAIKLFPVIHALKAESAIKTIVCVTGQHREILDQVNEFAGVVPDIDLSVMAPDQTLDGLTAKLLVAIGQAYDAHRPDRVIVQGDTATAMVGALAAYYRKIPVAHVEAGLRSGNIHHPWPEEVNRKIVGAIADLHFAPTETAADALRRENVRDETIFTVGNTVIDALQRATAILEDKPQSAATVAPVIERFRDKRIVLVTTHRRENFGGGMLGIAHAIRRIAEREDVAVIFPVHPNPHVRKPMGEVLAESERIAMIDPQDYPNFVSLLAACTLVLTDSGGVQEEAPGLGKPVLVMRETTERPEGVEAGTARLIGADEERIVASVFELLDNPETYAAMAQAHNPFGDGHSSERIVRTICSASGPPAAACL